MRYGLSLWAFFARQPRLYQFATGIASRLMAMVGAKNGRFASLPLAGGWTRHRDFPAPQKGGTFTAQWRKGVRK